MPLLVWQPWLSRVAWANLCGAVREKRQGKMLADQRVMQGVSITDAQQPFLPRPEDGENAQRSFPADPVSFRQSSTAQWFFDLTCPLTAAHRHICHHFKVPKSGVWWMTWTRLELGRALQLLSASLHDRPLLAYATFGFVTSLPLVRAAQRDRVLK